MADWTSNTGYEPNVGISVSADFTPIFNLMDNFQEKAILEFSEELALKAVAANQWLARCVLCLCPVQARALGNKKKLESRSTPRLKMRPEQQDLPNSKTILHSGDGIPLHTSGTHSHGGVIDYPRFPVSELHLAKSPDSIEFQSCEVNFKTEICAKAANPQITMQWITEVEKAQFSRF